MLALLVYDYKSSKLVCGMNKREADGDRLAAPTSREPLSFKKGTSPQVQHICHNGLYTHFAV